MSERPVITDAMILEMMADSIRCDIKRFLPMQFGYRNNDPWYPTPEQKTVEATLVRAD